MWLPLTWPSLGTWPATQACALTENWTGDTLVLSPCSIHWATPARAESHLEENIAKLCQETHLHWDQALPISLLRIRVAPWSGIHLVWTTISGYDWGGRNVYRSRSEGKENVQHLSQTLAVMNDLASIRDLSPTGLATILWAWRRGAPQDLEDRISRKPTRTKVDWTLGHSPHHPTAVKLAEMKPQIHHTGVKKVPEER